MNIIFSSTGSDGNCTVIENENKELIMVDCGIPIKQIDKAIGYRVPSILACLCTHKHFDHSASHKDVTLKSIPLYAPETEPLTGDFSAFQKRYYKTVEHGKTYAIRGRISGKIEFLSTPFRLVHCNAADGSDCPCVGYLISDTKRGGDKILLATDTAYFGMVVQDMEGGRIQGHRFPPCSHYLVESNYIQQEDAIDALKGAELSVEMRRVNSHMSAQTASAFIGRQDLSKCREIYLIHVSHSATDSDIIEMVRMFKYEIAKNETAKDSKKEIKIYVKGQVHKS